MHTVIQSWRRYVLIAAFFSICVNIIYLALPLYIMTVYDRALFSFSQATLFALLAGLVFSLAAMALLDYFQRRVLAQVGNMMALQTLPMILRHLSKESFALQPSGYRRCLTDLELLRAALAQGTIVLALDAPWMFIYLIILAVFHPLIGGVAIVSLSVIALLQVVLFKLEQRRYTIADSAFHSSNDAFHASMRYAETAAAMGMLPLLNKRYLAQYHSLLGIRAEAETFATAIGAGLRFLFPLTLAALFASGVVLFFQQKMSAGALFAVVILGARLLSPFERMLGQSQAISLSLAAYKRLRHFITLKPPIDQLPLPPPSGKVQVEGLSLALSGRILLHSISFMVEPGHSLGILGPSPAGKTLLCKTVLGLWPPSAGSARLDGAESHLWSENDLRAYVGYLPQQLSLFPGTLAENIARMQTPAAEKVVLAAQQAGIHELILQLPQGYETVIDPGVTTLPPGQQQLLSLARALYDQPRLLILDEPQTHLDDKGLTLVFRAIQHLKGRASVIVVTDRTEILAFMDNILVLRDGHTAMYGPAQEILNRLINRQPSQQGAA